jgi:hypothetical protein
MVYGTNPTWITNMRTFGEMAIIARDSDKKIRSKLSDRGNTVMFVGYSDIHEKDVYQFMNIETKKTMFSREVIWLNKPTRSTWGYLKWITCQVKWKDMEVEEAYELEGEGHVGPPPTITKEDHIEQLMDVPKGTTTPTIVAPYPTSTTQLRSFVVHALKKMSKSTEQPCFIHHTTNTRNRRPGLQKGI